MRLLQPALFIFLLLGKSFAGTITLSATTLNAFGSCPVFYATDPQFYTVSGFALTHPIIITSPDQFEISLSYSGGYCTQLTLTPVAGTVGTTKIFVKFSPYNSGSKSGSVSHASTGTSSQFVSVSGTATSTPASGTNSSNYYSLISTTATGATLKSALYSKIQGHTVTSYSGLWATYSSTDPFYNGKVWDIYSTRIDTSSPFEFIFSTNQCGNYSVEGDCYNREHSFPQSWFNNSSPMVSDMFHIYPTDGKVNGVRNNYPFGEVSSPTYTSMQGGKLGPNTFPGYTGTVFEPINDYKGDLARSYFYMATRYDNLIGSWQTNGNADDVLAGNSFPGYDSWFINLLIKWHNQDPPGVKEINRNNTVYSYQANRNPFIDSPQYVNRIWGGSPATEPTIAASQFRLINNTANAATISWKGGAGQRRIVIARENQAVNALPVDYTHYTANSQFGSGTQLSAGNYVVYNGMGNCITVTGLNSSSVYYFTVIEYNGIQQTANYLTSTLLTSPGITIPVTWLALEALLNERHAVELTWKTASEVNNSYFTVERSENGSTYSEVGKVISKGHSATLSGYSFEDTLLTAKKPLKCMLTYRIRQTDNDGKYTYSKTASVSCNTSDVNYFTVQSLVESDQGIWVQSTEEINGVEIRITDMQGNVYAHLKTNISTKLFIPFEKKPTPGYYLLNIYCKYEVKSFKIIIK